MPVIVPALKETEKHTRPMSETISNEIVKISGLIELEVVYQYALFRLKEEFPGVLDVVNSRQDFKSRAATLLIDNLKTDIELARILVAPDVSPNQLKSAGLYVKNAYDKLEKIIQIAEEVEHEAKKQQILFDCGFVRHPERGSVSFITPENSRILSIIAGIQEVWINEKKFHPDQTEIVFPLKFKEWEQNADFTDLRDRPILVEIKTIYPDSYDKTTEQQEQLLRERGLSKPAEWQLALGFLLNFIATGRDLFEGTEVRADNVTLKFTGTSGLANSFFKDQPLSGKMGVAILIKESVLD